MMTKKKWPLDLWQLFGQKKKYDYFYFGLKGISKVFGNLVDHTFIWLVKKIMKTD